MGLHQAETAISAPAEQVWQTVTSTEFSIWPGGLEVSFDPAGELCEGTEVYSRISIPGISGVVVSRIVECEPPYRLATELIRTHHLPVSPDSAFTTIEGTEDQGLTTVRLEIDLRFNGLKRIVGKALDIIMSQELQSGLDQMKANFEKAYKL
jgi:uncharacterized protein YndB with AHSA1/START domain